MEEFPTPEKEKSKEELMKEAGEALRKETPEGEPFNINKVLTSKEGIIIDLAQKRQVEMTIGSITLSISSKMMIAQEINTGLKEQKQKYINFIDGKLTICDEEYEKKVVDEAIKNDESLIDDLEELLKLSEIDERPIPEYLEHVKEKYLKNRAEKVEFTKELKDRQEKAISDLEKALAITNLEEAEKQQFREKLLKDMHKAGRYENLIDFALSTVLKKIEERQK